MNTGEVVVAEDSSPGEGYVVGDTVNVAARLEQAAQPGEILVGADTVGLVRDAVTVEAVPPLDAKGKSEPVPAYRLLSLDAEAPAFVRRGDVAMVGRDRQLKLLRDAFDNVASERSCGSLHRPGPGRRREVAADLGVS